MLLSGVVLGMVHARRTARNGWWPSARAAAPLPDLYLTSVAVVLAGIELSEEPAHPDQSTSAIVLHHQVLRGAIVPGSAGHGRSVPL